MHVTVTGATGLIGSRLVQRLLERGDRVTVLSRDPERARSSLGDVDARRWGDPGSATTAGPELVAALEGRDAVVNLAGEAVFRRWTDDARRRIRDSRVLSTRRLVQGLAACEERPAALVSGSASGIYGDVPDERVTEERTAGDDFLAGVAVAWEAEAARAAVHGVRVALVRTGFVLAANGGALQTMARPFRLGLGAWLGNGEQHVPWVHLDDEVGLILAALDDPAFTGPINAAAPAPATNKELSKALGRALHRPVLAGIPTPLLRLALGEAAVLLTANCPMAPARAGELGYRFAHPELEGALADLLD